MAEKVIKLRGIIGLSEKATPEYLEDQLESAEGADVRINMNSPGGFVTAGLEMANMISSYAGKTKIHIVGQAASMASYIAMVSDETTAEPNTVLMIHNARGGVLGADYRDAMKFHDHMKSLTSLLAEAYAQKSGKSLSEISGMMDDETFFYGSEINQNGFADAISSTDDKTAAKTRDEALAILNAEIIDCQAKMKEVESCDSDLERAAAYFKQSEVTATQPPASAGTTQKMEAKMDLTALLAANPEAKAEHDAIVLSATTAGETAGKTAGRDEMKATISAASPFLNNKEYPTLGALALKVITGEEAASTLTISVTAIDALKEQKSETAAEDEQSDETQGHQTTDAEQSESKLKAHADRIAQYS